MYALRAHLRKGTLRPLLLLFLNDYYVAYASNCTDSRSTLFSKTSQALCFAYITSVLALPASLSKDVSVGRNWLAQAHLSVRG